MLNAFLSGIPGNVSVKTVDVYALNPSPCVACNRCETDFSDKPLCAYNDLDEFFEDFERSGLVIIATPAYNASFPAPLKALFDRFQRYYSAYFALGRIQPLKSHRNAVLLVSAGHDGKYALEVMTHQCESSFSVMNTTLTGCVLAADTDLHEISDSVISEATALAQKVSKEVF